jgi:hypothetical protein
MSNIKRFKKLNTDNLMVTRLQENIDQQFVQITNREILSGLLLKNISLLTGSVNEIDHKLNRKPNGWFIVRKRGTADIWDTQDANNKPELTLLLNSDSNVNIDLWIF